MKKFIKITAVLFALLLCVTLVAQDYYDDDDPAPSRSRSRRSSKGIMSKNIAIGLIGSVHMKTTVMDQDDVVLDDIEEANKKANIGFSFRFFPLLNGKLGVGADLIHLQTISYGGFDLSEFMVDLNILLRIPVGRSLTLNAGLGYSQYMTSYTDSFNDITDSEWGKSGLNLKAGIEYFVSRNISISGDLKFTQFTYENFDLITYPTATEVKYRHFSVVFGVHYWL